MMRALVKECAPTGNAETLKPQAATNSVTPLPSSVFAVPDAQQSRKIRTSDRASSRVFCIPAHFSCRYALFFWIGDTRYNQNILITADMKFIFTLPMPVACLLSAVHARHNIRFSDHAYCRCQGG